MSLRVDIKKRLGNFRLDVSFESESEKLALLGSSGSGKSVTLRCIAGIMTPDEGHIELDGRVFYDSAKKIKLPPQERRVGYLFQQYALFPNMTVEQNIGAAIRRRALRKEAVAEKLRAFRLEDVAHKRPDQLSGGQQQRTALARILVSEPELLLLDEPFSALDSYLRHQLELELADTLSSFKGNVIWVSHDRSEVFRNCGQVCVIDSGSSEPVTTTETLFSDPGSVSAARLSGCKNIVTAVPEGGLVKIPDWNLELKSGRQPGSCISSIGMRAHHLRFAEPGDENAFGCTLVRAQDNVFSIMLILRPHGSAPGAQPLTMETDKETWGKMKGAADLTVAVEPKNILLLR